MAELCVIPTPHLGGIGGIGHDRGLVLTLMGTTSPNGPRLGSKSNLTVVQ